MRRPLLHGVALAWALAALAGHRGPLAAQDRVAETRALSEAGNLEVRGELREAVLVLERVLATHPQSPGALIALDRLLHAQRRSLELLPFVNRFLSEDVDAPAVRVLTLRILAEADSADAVEREARAWIRADPRDVERYRQSAPHWERALGVESTLELLVEGRENSEDEGALAAEMGDLLLKSDRPEEAARQWARAVDGSTEGAAEVVRRIRLLHPDARSAFVGAIVAALDGPGAGPEGAHSRRPAGAAGWSWSARPCDRPGPGARARSSDPRGVSPGVGALGPGRRCLRSHDLVARLAAGVLGRER